MRLRRTPLVLALAVVCAASLGATTASVQAGDPPRFLLVPTEAGAGMGGIVTMTPSASPFVVAAAENGQLAYLLTIVVSGADQPSRVGEATAFVAWVATPSLDHIERLGVIGASGMLHGRTTLNKFIVLVTAERSALAERRSGAVVLRGFSPSSLLQSFRGHAFFEEP